MTYFQTMFSSDSSVSYGRFASFIALICLLIWTSLLIPEAKKIIDVPSNWLFLICVPFGISKLPDTINALKGPQDAISKTQ